ncbi:MAG TPA: phosphotransferase [bacterium]|nr:phosphotransferase [bacterium]
MTITSIEKAKFAVAKIEMTAPYDLLLHRLAGDASDRRYYRVTYGAFGEAKSVVMMELADPARQLKSEEVTLYHDESEELPFLNIHRFLSDIGAPAPRVLVNDVEHGVLLLEDLGDTLLLDVVRRGDREEIRKLYKRALDILVYLQTSGTERLTDRCMARRQTFSTELFLWEFRHFIEYGIEARLGPMPSDEKLAIDELCRQWSAHLAGLPTVFVHRDYHCRNLMVDDNRLVLIDFQDALLGPATYDLASLLRDSYVDLGWELVDELVEYYLAVREKRTGEKIDRAQFATDLWITAMQRNLKAAGRFVFIERVKKKPGYEKDIPRTLSYLAGYKKRAPQLAPLIEKLRLWAPEIE